MSYLQKIKDYALDHLISSIVILLIVVGVGYWGYGKITSTAGDTRYVLSAVTKGTIVSSITGSGQVSVSSQIDLKPNVSGTITHIYVKPGDQAGSGKLLFSLDSKDAQKTLRDAQINLDAANLSLAKLQEPADKLSVIQYQNAIAAAQDAKKNQDLVVKNAHSSFLNSGIVAVPKSTSTSSANFTAPTISGTYTGTTEGSYDILVHNSGSGAYLSVSGLENGSGTVNTTTPVALGTFGLYIQFPNNYASSGINEWTVAIPNTQASSYGASYNSYQLTLQNQAQVNTDSDRTIIQNTEALSKLQSGADVLDIQTAQLTVKQKENALQDARDNLSYYNIVAPFEGTVASVPVNVGETASSGTILGTIITTKQLATISLNEVDVAKIKLGQKATLTFDAIPNFSIAGEVAQIDTVGTVTQGVVTYNVKISFDNQDSTVKPGMSVSASIITNVKQDVLVVPNSAVKRQGGSSYVEMFDAPLPAPTDGLPGSISTIIPNKITVTTGLSNNSETEIVSGIKEGDEIVTRTILPTAAKTATSSLLGGAGGNRGGGAVRIPGN